MRSAAAKSRRLRAARRSASIASISAGRTSAPAGSTPRMRSAPRIAAAAAAAPGPSSVPSTCAALTSRRKVNRTPSASAVLRSSSRAAANSPAEALGPLRRRKGSRLRRALARRVVEPPDRRPDPLDRGRGAGQRVPGEVELLAIRNGEQQVTHRHRVVPAREHVVEREEVAFGLGHLLAVHDQVLGVEPDVHEGVPRRRLALRDLVLVVRERCCPPRRCACRSARRGTSCSSPSTRCASPGARRPTARATRARPAWRPSRGRNP